MKTKTLFLCIILFLPIALVAQDKQGARLSIVFIGNSITQGKGGASSFPPPTNAVDYLRTLKGVADVAFANVGKSGSTTLDWLPGTGKYHNLTTRAADTLFPIKDHQLVFSIKLGTNDSAMEGPNGAPVAKENYRKNMMAIISDLLTRYPGSKVVVHHPIWYSENTYNRSKYLKEGLDRLRTYIPELEALVLAYKASHPGQVFIGDTKAFKYFKKHHLKLLKPENGQAGTFYLHPNETGVTVLGNYWGKAIAKAIL